MRGKRSETKKKDREEERRGKRGNTGKPKTHFELNLQENKSNQYGAFDISHNERMPACRQRTRNAPPFPAKCRVSCTSAGPIEMHGQGAHMKPVVQPRKQLRQQRRRCSTETERAGIFPQSSGVTIAVAATKPLQTRRTTWKIESVKLARQRKIE